MAREWNPDWWPLRVEPEGADEAACKALYLVEMESSHPPGGQFTPWEELEEWKREAWRREVRDR